MQHVRIIHPPCYFGQEPIMSDVVKVAAQIDVYDTCFLLTNCSGHPFDRFMRCPLGTISKRSRLEVCLEDRLQYELERPLHHAVPNCRNRKYADFVPVFRYFLPPGRQRCIGLARGASRTSRKPSSTRSLSLRPCSAASDLAWR